MSGEKAKHSKHLLNRKRFARKLFTEEINLLKNDVREAYRVSAQLNIDKGYEPTPEELKQIEEQHINIKLIEKLEGMRDRVNEEMNTKTRDKLLAKRRLHTETTNLLHFFYIVRLAQQGFFYLISGVLPTIEPQAVTYLCDTLISSSIYASRSSDANERLLNRERVLDLYTGLVDEVDEPVAEGFKTTFKDVMKAAHMLMDKSIGDKQDGAASKNPGAVPPPSMTPPVWFVMPYTSMIDSQMYAMPGSRPTLPHPHLSSNGMILPNVVAPVKRNHGNKFKTYEKKYNTDRNDNGEQQIDRTKEGLDQVESKNEENVDEKAGEKIENKNDEITKEDNIEDDRFADPDTSDDEDDEEEEEEEEEDEHTDEEEIAQENIPQQDKPEKPLHDSTADPATIETNAINTATSDTKSPSESSKNDTLDGEAAKANSSWLNFAASSPTIEPNTSSFPRHSSQKYYKSPKNY